MNIEPWNYAKPHNNAWVCQKSKGKCKNIPNLKTFKLIQNKFKERDSVRVWNPWVNPNQCTNLGGFKGIRKRDFKFFLSKILWIKGLQHFGKRNKKELGI